MKHYLRKRRIKKAHPKDSVFAKINALSTLALVLITGFYAFQTRNLTRSASDQMLLSAEPNIELESEAVGVKLESGRFKFILSNQSPVDIKRIDLYSNYYTLIADQDLNEYLLNRGLRSTAPDTTIEKLNANTKTRVYFDYNKRSGLLNSDSTGSFYVGSIDNPKEIPTERIKEFYHFTFADYRIEYQRELDGKRFSRTFSYTIALYNDPVGAILFRNKRDDMIQSFRQGLQILKMSRKKAK